MAVYQPGPSSGSNFRSFTLGDTTLTKVFVGGLAWETRSATLRRHFEQFGDIIEAVVITDKNTTRSKGYGFVTFLDPESAKKACVDPTPVIDGRMANCNLASLGRPRPPPPFGRVRSTSPFLGGASAAPWPYHGSFGYQEPLSYGYPQGYTYPQYGYLTYGSEYNYPQAVYNPYITQQYVQAYGVPGSVNIATYAYNIGHNVPSGHGYTTSQSYALPGSQTVQFGGVGVTPIAASSFQTLQTPYLTGARPPVPAQMQRPLPSPSLVIQGSESEQNAA